MMRTVIAAAALGALLLAGSAQAQFGNFLDRKKDTAAPADVSAPPDAAAQEALVRQFQLAQARSVQAQVEFAKAFGLADKVQLLEGEALSLSGDTVTVKDMKKTRSVTEEAQIAIDAKLAEKPELSAEARVHYAEGLVNLLLAANEGRKLTTEASRFANGLRSGNPLQIASMATKLVAGAWVAKETPGYVKNLYGSTRSAVTFAKQSKIKLPANADSLLDSLE